MAGVLLEHAGAAGGEGHALDLVKELGRALALVDAGAGAEIDDRGIVRVDDDGEDVGVVDQALLDAVPGLAPVLGLPGQVPGAGVNDVGVARVDGHRLDVLDLGVMLGRDALPGVAGVAGAEDAVERARHQGVVIGDRHSQGADGLAVHAGQGFPGLAPVVAAEDVATAVLHAPGGDVEGVGVGWVDQDVIEDVVEAVAQVGKARPGGAAIGGEEHLAGAGAEVDAVGILRVVGQAAHVAAIRTQRGPGGSGKEHRRQQAKQSCH